MSPRSARANSGASIHALLSDSRRAPSAGGARYLIVGQYSVIRAGCMKICVRKNPIFYFHAKGRYSQMVIVL